MSAYREPGERPRRPYAAPKLVVHWKLWWGGPLWYLFVLRWMLFGFWADREQLGERVRKGEPTHRRLAWRDRRLVLAHPLLMSSSRRWPKWWRRKQPCPAETIPAGHVGSSGRT